MFWSLYWLPYCALMRIRFPGMTNINAVQDKLCLSNVLNVQKNYKAVNTANSPISVERKPKFHNYIWKSSLSVTQPCPFILCALPSRLTLPSQSALPCQSTSGNGWHDTMGMMSTGWIAEPLTFIHNCVLSAKHRTCVHTTLGDAPCIVGSHTLSSEQEVNQRILL